MRYINSFLGLAAVCLTGCTAIKEQPENVALARNGKPLADIVIAENADKAARFAAQELQYHLKQITGGDFLIVTDASPRSGFEIRVGESKRTALGKKDFRLQEYVVDVEPGFIELLGYDKNDNGKFTCSIMEKGVSGSGWPSMYEAQGTMYAVYDFLENQCGVKWLDSTDYGTDIPKNPNLTVPVGKKRTEPFMSYRGGTIDWSYEPLLWKRGSEGEKRYNRAAYGNPKNMQTQKLLFLLRRRAGGDFAPANHSFYNFYERFLLKDHKNFESYKPQYFAKGYTGEPPQLCYSNPETLEQVVKDIRNYFDNGGYKKTYRGIGRTGYIWGENYFCLEPMDNSSFCRCPDCMREYEPGRTKDHSSQSTHWFRFVNKVAEEIKKSHPQKKITTLAYAEHEGLPTGFKLEDNVVVYFCISANRMPYLKLLPSQLNRMAEWRKAYPDQPLAMWLYNTFPKEIADNGNFHCFPGFFAHETERQYRIFKDLNIRAGVFHCGFFGETDNYQHLKYMMDPTPGADAVLDGYFASFGKAGKPLREYYDIVEKRYCDPGNYPEGTGHQTVRLAWGVLGNAETMKRLGELMDKAEKAAETDTEKARVNLWKLGVYDYMKEGYDSYVRRSSAPVPLWNAWKVAPADGNPDKIEWEKIKPYEAQMFVRGSDIPSKVKASMKMAHDGSYFYLELVEFANPEKLVVSPLIAPYDTWELTMTAQEAQPYRYYMSSPDGRMIALSYGEVNWRQGVSAAESGHPSFGAVCRTNLRKKDRWITRYAFPLSNMLNVPLAPGGCFFMNIVRVTNPALYGHGRLGIYTMTSYTTVHTVDRAGKVTLGK